MLFEAIVLSFGIWFGSVITSYIFRSTYSGGTEPPEFFMPPLTRFAVDRYVLLIVITCLFSCVGLLLSLRRGPDALVGAIGVAAPLLVGWVTLFSLSFDLFLGPVSLHHPQRFDFGAVLSSYGGFFPITLILILLLFALFVRDALKQLQQSHPTQ